ncbi:MAG: matrixin family metalloprotease [Fimbriimonadaceae bacterium]|nr:matrixin family metalloprotease [Fimbriimonadaceae bacterium]
MKKFGFGLLGLALTGGATLFLANDSTRPSDSDLKRSVASALPRAFGHSSRVVESRVVAGNQGEYFGICQTGFTADGVPVSVLFAPGTSEAYMRQVMRDFARQDSGLDHRERAYNPGQRWTTTANGATGSAGNPIVLTYSFVPDGTNVPAAAGAGAAPSNLFSTMNSKFGGNTALWQSKFAQIYAGWAGVAGLMYDYESADDGVGLNSGAGVLGTRGDVRVSARNIDGSSGVLAYNYYPNSGDMCIDSSENWANQSNDYRFLRNTLGHEHGHGLGFGHSVPCDNTKLMEPFLNTGFDMVQHDDIRAGHWYYGDALENNDTAGTASDAGILPPGGYAFGTNLSLDRTSDVDFYKFRTTGPAKVTLTLTPVGRTYTIGNQSSGCSGTTSSVNSTNLQDLGFQLLDSNGTTVLATVNNGGLGVQEKLTNFQLTGVGPYYIRVFGSGTNDVQMYDGTIELSAPPQVSGTIALQDYGAALSGVTLTFEIRNPGGSTAVETVQANPNDNGSWTFQTNLTGTYDLLCKGPTWLRGKRTNVVITAAGASGQTFDLKNGDVNGDNTVNIADFIAVRAAFGSNSGSANWNAAADLNKDGNVNIADFLIVRKNLGQAGA